MNVLLVDDHTLFRQGLRFLLADLHSDLSFVECSSCEAMPESGDFDLILLDYHLPGLSELEALEETRSRFEMASVVVLSGEDCPAKIRRIVDHGASGFIPKASPSDLLVAALKLILAGGVYLPPKVLNASPEELNAAADGNNNPSANHPALSRLSARQKQALQLAVQGKVNKVIARELNISESTVKAHLSAAFRALGVSNRTEAVFAVAKAG